MRLTIDRDLVKQLVSGQLPNKSRHLDELTHEPSIWQYDTGQWLACFDSCQLTILWMANVKDVDLPRHAWETPLFLLIVSPTLPVQSVDAYVRTYVRSVIHVTTKRKEADHILWVWGSVPRALRARRSPAIKILILNWPWMQKFSHLFKGKTFSYHRHTLIALYVQFLCSDWLKFDRWVHVEKFMQHLETCLLWQLKLTEFCVNLWFFFNCSFPLDV